MASFLLSLVLLVVGYFTYGVVVERVFGIDTKRITPAVALEDGVDYVPMTWGKIFLIQFLNIAGLGPIFGAVMGALFGPAAFLWIVLGTIFAGGVHDYLSGMMSMRHDGKSIPEVVGMYLGNGMRQVMRVFSVVLLILVGTVFMAGPAGLLANLGFSGIFANKFFWV
ncbi:MAG: carbon starvation protein A, partial [Spirochaetales bacterium]|nr:carbon starvation protein A [Spirochaetales bacterium]